MDPNGFTIFDVIDHSRSSRDMHRMTLSCITSCVDLKSSTPGLSETEHKGLSEAERKCVETCAHRNIDAINFTMQALQTLQGPPETAQPQSRTAGTAKK